MQHPNIQHPDISPSNIQHSIFNIPSNIQHPNISYTSATSQHLNIKPTIPTSQHPNIPTSHIQHPNIPTFDPHDSLGVCMGQTDRKQRVRTENVHICTRYQVGQVGETGLNRGVRVPSSARHGSLSLAQRAQHKSGCKTAVGTRASVLDDLHASAYIKPNDRTRRG
jgi:hypothetical protein